MKTTAPLLALLALLCAPALAQEPEAPPQANAASVKVQPVKASGARKKDAKPAIPPQLEAHRETLRKTPYDRFVCDGMPSQAVVEAPGAAMAFDDLPQGYSLVIAWSEAKGGELELDVTLSRTKQGEPKAKVASMKVRLKDGASYLLKCPGAFADGDLLLVVSAKRRA